MYINALLLAISLTCQEPSCYTITSNNCNGNVCDITEDLKSKINKCEKYPPISPGAGTLINPKRVGCRFELPAGRLFLTETVELCRQHDIIGQGGSFWGARTVIEMGGGVTGFHLKYHDECSKEGKGGGSGGSTLEGFALVSRIGQTKTLKSVGILVESARTRLKDLYISKFVVGIDYNADVNQNALRTNASGFYLESVRVDGNEWFGIRVAGGDVNAGLMNSPDAVSNCIYANRWNNEQFPECSNIHIGSFLGTTIIGGHSATCRDVELNKTCKGYNFKGDSQRSVCIGCYSEGNNAGNELSQHSIAVGGLSDWSGNGSYLFGHRMNRLIVINDNGTKDKSDDIQIELGNGNPSMVGLQVRFFGFQKGAWPLALGINTIEEAFSLRIANQESRSILRIFGTNHNGRLGRLHLLPNLTHSSNFFFRKEKSMCNLDDKKRMYCY